jgi:transposase InsO family protein
LQQLIAAMAAANRTWGEERIADELLVKLGIRISPRTVRRYMPSRPPRARPGTQAWSTFVRNHARAVLASDFLVVVTATFRIIYVFVVLEVGTRRILHWNVTEHPTADWTGQQFRMIVPDDQGHRFVIHDRDTIYSEGVDRTLGAMGLTVLKTPARVPQANTFCERVIGTIRRECLDFMIPLTERHLLAILQEWISHYNRGRPHSRLGPGLPYPPPDRVVAPNGHQPPVGHHVVATPILGGLHHEYRLEAAA